MSYILDALKKSERQRQLKQVPTLETLHDTGGPKPRRRRWPWAMAAIVLVNAVALAVLFRSIPEKRVMAVSEPPAALPPSVQPVRPSAPPLALGQMPKQPASRQSPGQSSRQPPQPSPLASVPPRPPGHSPGPPAVPTPISRKPAAPVPTAPTRPPTRAGRPAVPQAQTLEVARVPAAATRAGSALDKSARSVPQPPSAGPSRVSVSLPRPQTAIVPETEFAPEPERPASQAASGPGREIPLLQETPFEFQRHVPHLRIDALVYSEDAAGRMAFIGNHKYIEGQQVEGNLRVERITREGVILSYQGQRFLLPP